MNKIFIGLAASLAILTAGGVLFYAENIKKNINGRSHTVIKEFSKENSASTTLPAESNEIKNIKNSTSTAKRTIIASGTPLKNIESAINECRQSKDSALCFDTYFREYLKTRDTKKTLAEIDALQNKDTNIRLFCHEIVHSIGRETLKKTGTIGNSFNACDQTCHSGCYHGAMERFLRGEEGAKYGTSDRTHVNEEEFKKKFISACSNNEPVNFRFQCLHGLGHAILFTLGYNLFKTLSWCDHLPADWDQKSCFGGVFMENITALDKSKRFLSKTDYHFPCNMVEEKYKSECYVMQTSRMFEMGLSTEKVAEECKKTGNYRKRCFTSLGRDKSNDVRSGHNIEVSKTCASFESEEDKNACVSGASFALSDNTWDGRYVFPFCESFEKEDDKRYCYNASINYLKISLVVSKNKILESCKSFVPGSTICVEETSKLP